MNARAVRRVLDRSGQVTVEYITLLAVIVTLTLFAARLLRPIVLRIQQAGTSLIQRTLDSADLHQSPFKR